MNESRTLNTVHVHSQNFSTSHSQNFFTQILITNFSHSGDWICTANPIQKKKKNTLFWYQREKWFQEFKQDVGPYSWVRKILYINYVSRTMIILSFTSLIFKTSWSDFIRKVAVLKADQKSLRQKRALWKSCPIQVLDVA